MGTTEYIFIGIFLLSLYVAYVNSFGKPKFKNNLFDNKKHKCGLSINDAKKILETTTHCGKYWDIKAKSKKVNNDTIVYVYMEGNEYVEINLTTGSRRRTDLD